MSVPNGLACWGENMQLTGNIYFCGTTEGQGAWLLDGRATWLYLKFIAEFFVIKIKEKEPL